MLRINLLPPYIYDKQKKIKWIVASVGIFAATLGVLLWWLGVKQTELEQANKRNEEANNQKAAYDAKVTAIKQEQDKVAVTKAKEEFVANAKKYNDEWPRVYAQMRDITTPTVLLKSMNIADDHKTINFAGFCPKEEDLVRWWMFLRSTQLFSTVHFNLPEHPWPPKAAPANNGGGPAGFPGGGGFTSPGGGSAGYSGGSSGFSGGSGPASISAGGFTAPGGSSGFAGSSGSFGGGGGGGDTVGEEVIEGRTGVKFTAAATLKQPLAGGIPVPTWPPGGGGTPAGGGGAPGYPGGSSGFSGGSGGGFPIGGKTGAATGKAD